MITLHGLIAEYTAKKLLSYSSEEYKLPNFSKEYIFTRSMYLIYVAQSYSLDTTGKSLFDKEKITIKLCPNFGILITEIDDWYGKRKKIDYSKHFHTLKDWKRSSIDHVVSLFHTYRMKELKNVICHIKSSPYRFLLAKKDFSLEITEEIMMNHSKSFFY